jgi:hypothetical protein
MSNAPRKNPDLLPETLQLCANDKMSEARELRAV